MSLLASGVNALDDLDLLIPAPRLSSLNFMFTEKCNLKCVYCPQHSVSRPMMDASAELLQVIVTYILNNHIQSAGIGFYGETLCFKGWESYVQILLDAGVSMSLCSNWNHKLSNEEVDVLSRFSFLQFSIDTADQELLRSIRPSADIKVILYNMHLIRSRSLLNGMPIPTIMWCSVLSNRNIPVLSELVAMAISNGVAKINFNELEYYSESSQELVSVFDLHGRDFIVAVDAIEKMDRLAKKYGVEITYAFNSFLQMLHERKNRELDYLANGLCAGDDQMHRTQVSGIQGVSSHLSIRATSIQPSENGCHTRLCLAPWNSVYVLADGTVCTCCVRGESMGRITTETSLDDILASNTYREFRWRLLTGNIIDNACLACPVTPIVKPVELLYHVSNLLKVKYA